MYMFVTLYCVIITYHTFIVYIDLNIYIPLYTIKRPNNRYSVQAKGT